MKPHKIVPHMHNGRFYNDPHERRYPFFFQSLCLLFECYWNSVRKNEHDAFKWHVPHEPVPKSEQLTFTWIGHSTFLIQAAGINIITDPVFGDLGPFFRRTIRPGIVLSALPAIDYVLISHNHRDHMDSTTLHYLKRNNAQTCFLVPKGNKIWFQKRGFERVTEYTWWEQAEFKHHGTPVTFSFLPAHHWSQRTLLDLNKTLWGSWMISINGEHTYFAGDTAYSSHFSSIFKEFPSITSALMPIGPCEPRGWMKDTHVSAEEAGQAFLDLQARHFIPMHWGTFGFGIDSFQTPYERILSWWQKQQMPDHNKLITLKMGQPHIMPPEVTSLESPSHAEQSSAERPPTEQPRAKQPPVQQP